MKLLDRIKKRFGSNNNRPPQECKDGHNCESTVIEDLDTTIFDANERIEKMLKEMRAE